MREMSVTEQRYKAVLAVIAEGRTVTQVARDWNVARQTVHVWLERYEADGLEGLANRSHRPAHCPHQMSAAVEAQLLEMRRAKPYWGARRLALELARKGVQPAPSKSAILPLVGASWGHRPAAAAATQGDLEALGACGANGALAVRCCT